MEEISFLEPEEQEALERAVKVLSKRRRIMLTIVPEGASEELCKRVTTWTDYILDTGLLPPIPIPATLKGDYLTCPYCGVSIDAQFPKKLHVHKEGCDWRQAVQRWAYANMVIDGEEGRV